MDLGGHRRLINPIVQPRAPPLHPVYENHVSSVLDPRRPGCAEVNTDSRLPAWSYSSSAGAGAPSVPLAFLSR